MSVQLRKGYGYGIVANNVHDLIESGVARNQAVAACFALARRCFFEKHPAGALPEWLAYPHNYRLQEHYDLHGRPNYGVKGYRNNPTQPRREVAQAKKLLENFTGKRVHSVKRVQLPQPPKAGVAFGQLIRVGYKSERDGKLYAHTFRRSSRPLLIASSDGKQLLIVGGRYNFTDRGIEDA